MGVKVIKFESDKVSVRTGRVDNSAIISFEVGEFMLDKIKDLVSLRDIALKVVVTYDKNS